jgi:hypothetical protein
VFFFSDLVLEPLGDTDDHVLDQRLYCPQAGNVLATTVPDDKFDLCRLFRLLDVEVHVDVLDSLEQRS